MRPRWCKVQRATPPFTLPHSLASCCLRTMENGNSSGGLSPLLFLLFFLFPGVTSAPTREPQYLVLVPFLIHTETTEKVCVHLSHLNETVMLSITLEYGPENRSLIRDVVSQQDVFRCIHFQLPKWSSASEVFLTVVVKGLTHKFRSRKTVLVKNRESLVFVQTDKPVYKPAQKVQFRIVSLNESFYPLDEKFPLVYVQDPKRNHLFQWRDVELERGISQLSFPLASEPMEGTYTVVVEKTSGKKVERAFTVKEYVLPKFEVLVKVPKIITIMAKEIDVTVCGRYTYGKPVPGLVEIHVCREHEPNVMTMYLSRRECPVDDSICLEFSGKADEHGCFSKVVKTGAFQLRRYGFQKTIKVEGKITEEGTGVELTGQGSTNITEILSKIIFESVDTYYKPGIAFSGQVKLVDGIDRPIANKSIQIFTGFIAREDTPVYITNDQGRAQFSIDTTNFRDSPLTIMALTKLEVPCSEMSWIYPHHLTAHHVALPFYSLSQSYVHVESILGTLNCGHPQPIQVHYVLNPGVMEEKTVFYYLVMSKGRIVQEGTHILPINHGEAKGVFLLNLVVDVQSAPLAHLLVYTVLSNREVVAHSADFTVENCFSNKVKLHFSDTEGLPSSATHLHLSASQGSLCAIQAVDKSAFLLKPEAEVSPETVYNLLPVKDLKGYQYESHLLDEPNPNPCVPIQNAYSSGFPFLPFPAASYEGDTYNIFKDIGLKVFTSTIIRKLELCHLPGTPFAYGAPGPMPMPVAAGVVMPGAAGGVMPGATGGVMPGAVGGVMPGAAGGVMSGRLPEFGAGMAQDGVPGTPMGFPVDFYRGGNFDYSKPIETIRSIFPETWMWFTTTLDPEQEVDMLVTIPDTITEWKAGAFCTSAETGFGLSNPVSLKAFQPFFLEPTLPYSIVRGEKFILNATVFTYLQHCVRVSISLAPSPDFIASPKQKEEQSYCLCPNKTKTVSWTVTPKSLGELNFTLSVEAVHSDEFCGNELPEVPTKGRKDTVTRSLLVEPEGLEKEVVFSSLLCASGESQSATVSLTLPENVVEDSVRSSFCVLGDILSTAIQNLHQLLQMPYGCGEQNMALFAPNIYILDYLNKTGQLTEEIKSKATGYLVAGYQRQLNYKHPDGSYSTFGEGSSMPGNAWLTAFVLKSFVQASHHIFVEQRHILDTLNSLAHKQQKNGCFQSTGKLLHNVMKGGVVDEFTLSAYITIALLEISLPVNHTVVHNALLCLESRTEAKEIHVYTRALLAYAFSLAGKEEKRKQMLHFLELEAVKEEDGSIHWQRPGKALEKVSLPYYHPRAPSADVEMTAYVLLAYLSKRPAPAQEELTAAMKIVKWLSKQQNPTGGFASTQSRQESAARYILLHI
ncbi:alpha-2-macroglobulin-like isoform X2 [Sceloporus undulatus]|uniref:alpha-2-macroglobulin-like isoform X2 n=1 Tax=Sceloporus undulatus TaxID=8520 RepID=UPI001C4AA94F|nr:alpha-2-macroglobulin-like isoform X2 [Sceloporus undulatus]